MRRALWHQAYKFYAPKPPLRHFSAFISERRAITRAFKPSSRAWLSFMLDSAACDARVCVHVRACVRASAHVFVHIIKAHKRTNLSDAKKEFENDCKAIKGGRNDKFRKLLLVVSRLRIYLIILSV
eukprot:scaffold112853_cov15-Tisochrysis_lutea.AAC.1